MSNLSEQNNPGGAPRVPPNVMAMQAEYHVGPLPHPDTLERYEQIHRGTAERILHRFELEAEHRHAMEHKIVDAQISRQNAEGDEIKRGQWFALIIGTVGLAVGGAVAILSKTDAGAYAGGAIGGVTLVGLVTAFIVGRKTKPAKDDNAKE